MTERSHLHSFRIFKPSVAVALVLEEESEDAVLVGEGEVGSVMASGGVWSHCCNGVGVQHDGLELGVSGVKGIPFSIIPFLDIQFISLIGGGGKQRGGDGRVVMTRRVEESFI